WGMSACASRCWMPPWAGTTPPPWRRKSSGAGWTASPRNRKTQSKRCRPMQYDRKITISAGNNRRAMTWTPQTMLISELWARLQTPARGTETLAEYLNMKKAQQDDLKDVGGFMA